jgi:hypothetical protein
MADLGLTVLQLLAEDAVEIEVVQLLRRDVHIQPHQIAGSMLETTRIEDGDRGGPTCLGLEHLVHVLEDPVEETQVHVRGDAIPDGSGGFQVNRFDDRLVANANDDGGDEIGQLLLRDAQDLAHHISCNLQSLEQATATYAGVGK